MPLLPFILDGKLISKNSVLTEVMSGIQCQEKVQLVQNHKSSLLLWKFSVASPLLCVRLHRKHILINSKLKCKHLVV